MKKIILTSLFFLAFSSHPTQAEFIYGNYTTEGGKTVNLQGLEWMPLTYTQGLSRAAIEASSGFTDRFGNSWQSGVWRYASHEETAALLKSLWGGKYTTLSRNNGDGANWFLNTFGGLSFDSGYGPHRIDGWGVGDGFTHYEHSLFFYGNNDECSGVNYSMTCFGYVKGAYNYAYDTTGFDIKSKVEELAYKANSGLIGQFSGDAIDTKAVYPVWFYRNAGLGDAGSLLVRNKGSTSSPIPTPTSISLFLIGFCGLSLLRRKFPRIT